MIEPLTPEQRTVIDDILAGAADDGRSSLHEHEVYRILETMGLTVPGYLFLTGPEQLSDGLPQSLASDKLVLKVVSRDIPHKSKVGGVKRVSRDYWEICTAMERMRDEIPAHPAFAAGTPAIEGFLLAEQVAYSPELGNEILIGVKESLAFGPVISFSKGGSDAEHFARNFSSPNIKLLPLEREECQGMLKEARITIKYREEGHPEYIERIADAAYQFGRMFAHYSSLNPEPPDYIFSELEVNPLVFDGEHQLICIDGLANFLPRERKIDLQAGPNDAGLDELFYPEGIAVVGVSATDSGKTGNNIATLLHNLGRKDLYLVNVKGGSTTIADTPYEMFTKLAEIPERVDLVVVTLPAKLAPMVVEEAKAKGSKSVILIPGGFSEVQGGQSLETAILDVVAGTGMRLVGPNCLGIFRAATERQAGYNTLFIPEEKLQYRPKKESNVALLTQSGALGVAELDRLKDAIYPRVVVSYGNQIDVDPGDLALYFQKDPDIDVLAFYIEGFKTCGGRKFFDAVRQSEKPVIVYKAGRTDAGSRAAASHTASMTGDYKVALAAFEQAGAIAADHILDHKDLIKAFALMGGKSVNGRRVAGVVNAGFESTYAADSIGALELAELAPETREQLRKALPPFVGVNAFLDLTPMADDAVYERCVELLLQDPGVDCLFISIVPHTVMLHTKSNEMAAETENVAARIIRQGLEADKPMVVSVNAGTMYNVLSETLDEGGIPTFTTAERAMTALNRLVEYKLGR